MIGLKVDGKPLLRAYSIASPNWEEHLEFLSIKGARRPADLAPAKHPGGRHHHRRQKPTGHAAHRLPAARQNLYLIGTGTGHSALAVHRARPQSL